MDMTDDRDPIAPDSAPAQQTGSLTVRHGYTTRPTTAILVQPYGGNPGAGTEVDVLGVAGGYLDAALETIRTRLDRYAAVTGKRPSAYPVGHPDAPHGYLIMGIDGDEVRKALGVTGDLTPTDAEGRW